ncbi:EF-hand domain pair, putative [Trypanosoma equiperdum]|uniref:EF-hand domain-containing protein n=4 Tax=Trypanozoon TaxID=39700 RepID=Q584B0_TRYB2|nr:hypothetical protein, conserved [Trypanosoma brucei gambiense DAL972]XP_844483.1 hypothetical protein, conserved [Trypanosoma brucei brucei TREU927]AAX79804.1 hypothetical protein, conserved [Trypanosoma brucei]RHW73234.1 EF-hand domain pair [Trypanosoma brucei equiperdum]SCU69145.1 EF-hand domain pair, putative [Trypanosoma equiperdum]AAZ10924.1 hypothetical protein, conserved [Trypanosoma brucei brucei TREU927]CBH10633.1 hypothetical protein, conserved [Trypanosoma brucei gambiense DAL97|eukprot:XP_011772921.1 hypothetical protein, conserved [Trypanosoma brucei gambiense DAL972]
MPASASTRTVGDSSKNASTSSVTNAVKDPNVTLSRADVEAAFAFFDLHNHKCLKPATLKERLSAFYPNMTSSEYKFLLDEASGAPFTVDTLWNIIDNFNTTRTAMPPAVAGSLRFDPIREAFRIYDPQGSGSVDVVVLADIMKTIGFGDLSPNELTLLIRPADFDNDGKISLEDFMNFLSNHR